MEKHAVRPFYEYYFEPVGTTGMVFFQFMDDNFERGMQTKQEIEHIFDKAQIVMYILIGIVIILKLIHSSYFFPAFLLVFAIFLIRIFNPIIVNYKLYKAQKQAIFREGPTKDTENDIEPFDAA
jgi:hypothetical protein